MRDLRSVAFGGLEWYEGLDAPLFADRRESAWYTCKSPIPDCFVELLNAGLAFAKDHRLLDAFRARFAGIRPQDLLYERARAERRKVSFPVWKIGNELIVARYLERVMGWSLESYEPIGRPGRVGDWQFSTSHGRPIFVEVKSLQEPIDPDTGGIYGGIRPDYRPQLRSAMARAYGQLPRDDRATLVVLVGREPLSLLQRNIMSGDLFQALFGKTQITSPVMPFRPESMRIGPSFRDMFIHRTKHRQLGCVAGLIATGLDSPLPHFYAIQNPFAERSAQLDDYSVLPVDRFTVDLSGRGQFTAGLPAAEAWRLMAG